MMLAQAETDGEREKLRDVFSPDSKEMEKLDLQIEEIKNKKIE